MSYASMKYVAPEVIEAKRRDGSCVYIEPASGELWDLARAGSLGEVDAYTPPPEPTEAEKLEKWRAMAFCDMLRIQDALILSGHFSSAETAAAQMDAHWQIRWRASGGVSVGRKSAYLEAMAQSVFGEGWAETLDGLKINGRSIWNPAKRG